MNDNKIKGLGAPTDGNDGVTKSYVDHQIHLQANALFIKKSSSYILQPNFTFLPRGVANIFNIAELKIPSSQVNGFMKDLQHGLIYRVSPRPISPSGQYFQANFTARHNNLKPGNYTALFELFSFYNELFVNDFSKKIFYPTSANSNYRNIQTKSIVVNNNYKNIAIQFEVVRNPGFLAGEINWSRNNHSFHPIRFIFFSSYY